MAIYHLSVKAHSRAQGARGTSALALAAYRTGERLVDALTGDVYDYSRKRGVLHAELCHPDGVTPSDRQELWARMERRVRRRDGVVAREVEVSLPHELDLERGIDLARALARDLAARYRTAVDLGVHAPAGRGQRVTAGDARNVHAHLLVAPYALDRAGVPGDRVTALDPGPQFGGRTEVRRLRRDWQERCNFALEREGRPERIDHRTLRDQGIDRAPQPKRGRAATYRARRALAGQEHAATVTLADQGAGRPEHAVATQHAGLPSFARDRHAPAAVRTPSVDRAAARALAVVAETTLGIPPRTRAHAQAQHVTRDPAAGRRDLGR